MALSWVEAITLLVLDSTIGHQAETLSYKWTTLVSIRGRDAAVTLTIHQLSELGGRAAKFELMDG
jgi:hypothetical protein